MVHWRVLFTQHISLDVLMLYLYNYQFYSSVF